MDKNQAIEQIFSEYTDALGRVTLYPAKQSNNLHGPKWDSDNCFLWTGRFNNIFTWLNYINEAEMSVMQQQYMRATVVRSIVECSPNKVLYRHVPSLEYMHSDIYDRVSLDEYIGTSLMVLSCETEASTRVAEGLYEGLKKNGWSMDFQSYFKKRSIKEESFWKRTKEFFKTLKEVYQVAKATGKWGGSTEMDRVIESNYDLLKLSTIMLPKDRLFVKLAAEKKPSLIDWTHHYLNCFFSIRKKKLSGLMLTFDKLLYFERKIAEKEVNIKFNIYLNDYFQLEKVKRAKLSIGARIHLKLSSYFDKEMTKEFGENYMKTIATKYYRENPNHPSIVLYDNLRLGKILEIAEKQTRDRWEGMH